VLAARANTEIRLFSADFREWTKTFAPLCTALSRLQEEHFVLDGFVCAMGAGGLPSFDLLRAHVAKKEKAKIVFVVWDALFSRGDDLRGFPLRERRARLAEIARGAPASIIVSEALTGAPEKIADSVKKMGVRGIVGRDPGARYGEGWASEVTDWDRSLSAPPVVTNADKILFPRDGISKKEIVAYYMDVAPVLLPLMDDRPIVCQRWPDGIDDFTWYQHRVPPRAPDYLRAVWIEGNRRIVIENESALAWMANQAALTFHGFASRTKSLASPDWVVLDLDPGEQTKWETTIDVALAVRRLLELLELPSVVKTSGQKGLHILVPLAPGHGVLDAHEFAKRAATMIARLFPNDVCLEATTEKRQGRLYLDHLQSFVGKSLVLPYSLRAADGAPISAPIEWSEVSAKLNPRDFNLRSMRARLDRKGDLAIPLISGHSMLRPAIEKLRGQSI